MELFGNAGLTWYMLALLLVSHPVNAAGPPPSGMFSPSCPKTTWNNTLLSSSWGGVLPGDTANDVFPREGLSPFTVPGYPKSAPPPCYHGAGNYVGWLSTNGFVRAFMVMYDVLVAVGEAKHGFWQWSHAEQDDDVEFWWCQMGGNSNSTRYLSGHSDASSTGGHTDEPTNSSATMNGMQEIWEHIRQTPDINKYGPLALKAKLPDIVTTSIPMYHAAGVHTWGNNGDSTHPYYFPVDTLDTAEFYIFEAPYLWPHMFDGPEACSIDANITTAGCSLQNTFVGMVVEKHVTERYIGMNSSGLHYGPDAETCPDSCGAGPCRCNAVLFDLLMHGFLNNKYTETLEFLPTWVDKWLGPTGTLPTTEGESGNSDVSISKELAAVIAVSIWAVGILTGTAAIWFYQGSKLGTGANTSPQKQPPIASFTMNDWKGTDSTLGKDSD